MALLEIPVTPAGLVPLADKKEGKGNLERLANEANQAKMATRVLLASPEAKESLATLGLLGEMEIEE